MVDAFTVRKKLVIAAIATCALPAACGDSSTPNDSLGGGGASVGAGSAGGSSPLGGTSADGGAGGVGLGGAGGGTGGTGGGGANYDCGPAEGSVPTLMLTQIVSPADNVGAPVMVLAAPGDDDRLFIVNLYGTIRVLDRTTGEVLPEPFLDLTGLVATGGERGLLGVGFHPDYQENGRFFVHYSQINGGHTSVEEWARMTPDKAQPAPVAVVITQTQPFANHNGGTLTFGPDGLLYLFLGDGGSGGDPMNFAQNLDARLGKILRYDVDASPGIAMAGGYPGALPDVWTVGLRNPWRASFDACTGDLYVGDVGQNAWEEIDFLPPGSSAINLGWRDIEGTHCYLVQDCDQSGKTPPIYEYAHGAESASIVGGFVYRGSAIPGLRGRYMFADTILGTVWSLRVEDGVATDLIEHTELAQGLTLVSFGEDNDGELYLTDLISAYRIDAAQ